MSTKTHPNSHFWRGYRILLIRGVGWGLGLSGYAPHSAENADGPRHRSRPGTNILGMRLACALTARRAMPHPSR